MSLGNCMILNNSWASSSTCSVHIDSCERSATNASIKMRCSSIEIPIVPAVLANDSLTYSFISSKMDRKVKLGEKPKFDCNLCIKLENGLSLSSNMVSLVF